MPGTNGVSLIYNAPRAAVGGGLVGGGATKYFACQGSIHGPHCGVHHRHDRHRRRLNPARTDDPFTGCRSSDRLRTRCTPLCFNSDEGELFAEDQPSRRPCRGGRGSAASSCSTSAASSKIRHPCRIRTGASPPGSSSMTHTIRTRERCSPPHPNSDPRSDPAKARYKVKSPAPSTSTAAAPSDRDARPLKSDANTSRHRSPGPPRSSGGLPLRLAPGRFDSRRSATVKNQLMDDRLQPYRQPMVTATGIILGFVLNFASSWVEGDSQVPVGLRT